MPSLSDVFQGVGGTVIGVLLTWAGFSWKERRKMRAAEVDTTQAKDKSDRELLETVYSVLVTANPTSLVPHPPPGHRAWRTSRPGWATTASSAVKSAKVT